MHYSTRKKLEEFKTFIHKNFHKWKRKYPSLVGVHPGKKIRHGKELNRYAIVFLVEQKLRNPENMIPDHFMIKFRDGKTRKIPTDVVELGVFQFRSISLGDKNKRKDLTSFGSIGGFFSKDGNTYACTNMHVAFPDLISQQKTFFFRPVAQQFQPDVSLFNDGAETIDGFAEVAMFSGIDAALIRVIDTQVDNVLPGIGFPSGIFPMKSLEANMPLTMLGGVSKKQTGTVSRFGASIPTPVPNVKLDNLIITSIFSTSGDSGSPVYANDLRMVGIIIGGTPTTTFVLPIESIVNTLKFYSFKF
jgi:hypothetical protein